MAKPTQLDLDWLVPPAVKVFRHAQLVPIIGMSKESVRALHDEGELWGFNHGSPRGTGGRTGEHRDTRIVTRDSVVAYLAKRADYDEELREQRLAEALATVTDRAALQRLRLLIDRRLQGGGR